MKTLDDLLQDLYDCGAAHGKSMTYVYSPAKEAKSAIKELFKAAVPEEPAKVESEFYRGVVSYRQATLEAMDGYETDQV